MYSLAKLDCRPGAAEDRSNSIGNWQLAFERGASWAQIEFLLWNPSPRRAVLTSNLHGACSGQLAVRQHARSLCCFPGRHGIQCWRIKTLFPSLFFSPHLWRLLLAVRHFTLCSNICHYISEALLLCNNVDCVPHSSSPSSILTYALGQLAKAADVAHALTSVQAIQLDALFVGLPSLHSV